MGSEYAVGIFEESLFIFKTALRDWEDYSAILLC